MKLPLALWFAFTAMIVAEEVPRATVVIEGEEGAAAGESVSRTRQFRVTGGDGSLRGIVVMLADQARDELRAVLGETAEDEVKVPIRIILAGQPGEAVPANPVATKLFFDDRGWQLQIFVHTGRGIDRERLANTLTSALIHERTLRNVKPDGEERTSTVRPWIVDGLREANNWRLGQGDRRAYESLFKHGGLYNLKDLFNETDDTRADMDAAMRLAFQVSSGALVMALIEQPQGKESFGKFLAEVSLFEGEMPMLLRKHFPDLNLSETSLAKWWALQMASKGTPSLSERLTVSETEAGLNDALTFHVRADDGGFAEMPLGSWGSLGEKQPVDRMEAVRPAQDALTRLSYRCFPSYYPVIAGYQEVLAAIVRGKTKDVPEKLGSLEESRALMAAKAERAQDYMDWFEITRAREISGAFDDYLRLKDNLVERPHRRTDSVSLYLDRMDALFKHAQTTQQQASPPMMLPSP